MSYPAVFYNNQKQSVVSYQDAPTGDLDIDRIIRGKPCWKTRNTSKQKGKKLILSDWTARNWSYAKTKAVSKAIARMMDEGFSFYIWQSKLIWNDATRIWQQGRLKSLTKNELTCLEQIDVRRDMKPVFNEELTAAANAQYHIAHDDIHVLDDYWVQRILSLDKNDIPPRYLRESDLCSVLDGDNQLSGVAQDKLFRLLTEATPPIELVIEDIFDITKQSDPESITSQFPHARIEQNYQKMILSLELVERLFKDKRITGDNGITIGMDELVNITDLELTGCKISQLLTLLHAMPGLTRLNIKKELKQDVDLEIDENSLKNLEELVLHGNVRADVLQQFVFAAPKLKIIDLSNTVYIGTNTPFTPVGLDELEIIDLHGTVINAREIQHIFEAAPKLKKIDLSENPTDGQVIDIKFRSGTLKQLEEINLASSHLTGDAVQSLLTTASKLKKLNLRNINLEKFDKHWLKAGSLLHLEEVTLDGTNITLEALEALLRAAPNLQEISLLGCQLKGKLSVEPGSLPYLREIIYTDHYMDDPFMDSCWGAVNKWCEITAHSPRITKKSTGANQTLPTKPKKPNYKTYTEKTVDANTKFDPKKEFNLTRIFYSLDTSPDPLVSHYRLRVYNKIAINQTACSPSAPFRLQQEGDLQLSAITKLPVTSDVFDLTKNLKNSNEYRYVYGKQDLELSDQWLPIASLSPSEELTDVHWDPPSNGVDIQYSARDNLYYIRSKVGNLSLTLDFIIKIPTKTSALPAEVQTSIRNFSKFETEELKLDANATGEDYLKAIIDKKVGSCRHRAIAFVKQMEEQGFQARFIDNDCHCYVEIFHENQWKPCQLGGYPAKLNIHETNNPKHTPDKPLVSTVSLPSNGEPIELAKVHYYQGLLEPGKAIQHSAVNWKDYCRACVQPRENKNKRLIELASTDNVNVLRWGLQDYCKSITRPVFYVNSPDDLVCLAPYIARDKQADTGELLDTGQYKKGPGGQLYDFLTANYQSDNPPILIINYENFEADDIVRFNAILDDKRRADGTDLPESMIVIGLINVNKPNCYQGSDFYSRLDEREHCPLSTEELAKATPKLPLINAVPSVDMPVINLYHETDWEERLLGRWLLHEGRLSFEKGALIEALEKNSSTIVIKNGCWDDPSLLNFWKDATHRGYIEYASKRITIPENFKIIPDEGYDWTALKKHLKIEVGSSKVGQALNPTRLVSFFNRYDCDNASQTLSKVEGVIASYAHKTLVVNVTRTLGEDEWAMVLDACQKHDVKLHAYCSPSVTIPAGLAMDLPVIASEREAMTPPQIFVSNDIDTTLEELKQPEDIIIDVSECKPSDLLLRIDGKLNNKDPPCFEFKQSMGLLRQVLEDQGGGKKRVILKGHFSEEVADELTQYMFERERDPNKHGQLLIITEDKTQFYGLPTSTEQVSAADKLKHLNLGSIQLPAAIIEQESLSQLKARRDFLKANPGRPSEEAWLGMYDLPKHMHEVAAFNPSKSASEAKKFTADRIKAVNKMLKHSPFAFLTGLSGVGKSTFVEQEFAKKNVAALHLGENKIEAWALDRTSGIKLLFIDEANLIQRNWSEFEGLFHQPPSILVDNKRYLLSPEHKIVFAGNPCSYGDERQLATLFKQHGKAVVFNPLPPAFIYQQTLKPIFENTRLTKKSIDNICRYLLDVYAFLCAESKTDVLISPRELQMMALLVNLNFRQNPRLDVMDITRQVAWDLAIHLVPPSSRLKFDQQFKPKQNLLALTTSPMPDQNTEFQITESRLQTWQQLDKLFALREWRQQPNRNVGQKYGGLGGMVLEGEPGIGKSELVIASLRAHGFVEVTMDEFRLPTASVDVFYRMPVSMSIDDKEELLLKAFDEGAVVVIDEINCSPMMERFLNELLMGKRPKSSKNAGVADESGEQYRPQKPGFMIIGTQNPTTMAGRRATSAALQRRLINVNLPVYPADEIEQILSTKGLPDTEVESLVMAYTNQVELAQKNQQASPTFRALMRLADEIARAKGIVKANKEGAPPDVVQAKVSQALIKSNAKIDIKVSGSKNWFKDVCMTEKSIDKQGRLKDAIDEFTQSLLEGDIHKIQLNFDILIDVANEHRAKFGFFKTGRTASCNQIINSLSKLKDADSLTYLKQALKLDVGQSASPKSIKAALAKYLKTSKLEKSVITIDNKKS